MDNQFTFENKEYRDTYRHTTSHILAQAMKRLYPEVKLAIGPAIDDGFYYDFDAPEPFTPEVLEKLEAEMRKICKEKLKLERFELPRDEAIKFMAEREEPYKVELINDLPEDAAISFYKQGDFVDLCAGPHLDSTGRVKGNAIKLTSVTGAYWRGDSDRKMLQRIYGTCFPKKEELDAYLARIEEAKKRDHRRLGRELGLFAFRDEAPGFPFYLPKGMVLRNTLLDYWRGVHKKWDYVEINTPQIMRRTLWETSGHWDHYKDNMYTTVIDGEDFAIKPMNCPGSILVYDLEPHSYRELPLRYAELGLVHRHELSGALHGMFRVRCFTQDDAHILLAKEQIKDEVIRIASLFDEVYSLFGLPYTIELSTMPDDHIGEREDWEKAENALADAITSIGKTYHVNPGDGALSRESRRRRILRPEARLPHSGLSRQNLAVRHDPARLPAARPIRSRVHRRRRREAHARHDPPRRVRLRRAFHRRHHRAFRRRLPALAQPRAGCRYADHRSRRRLCAGSRG